MEHIAESRVSVNASTPVLEREGETLHVQMLPDLIEASKLILKSGMSLVGARAAKLYFLTEARKLKVLSTGSMESNPIRSFLVKKCFQNATPLYVNRGETILNEANEELGAIDFPMLFHPLLAGEPMAPFGLIYMERNPDDDDFGHEGINISKAFVKMVSQLLAQCSYNKEQAGLMLKFTSSLLVLIKQLHFYKSNLDNNRLVAHIVKISSMINSTLDLNLMLESIMDSAKVVLKAESSSLMLLDDVTDELYFNIVSGSDNALLKEIRIPLGQGVAGLVAQERWPMIVNDAQNDPRIFKEADQRTDFTTRNLLASPMIFQDRMIGVLEVINSVGREEFTDKDLELLSTFSDQAALAIQSRELVDSLKRTNKELNKKLSELSTLHEIGKVLISTLNQKDFFDSAVKILSEEIKVQNAVIILRNDETENFEVASQVGDSHFPNKFTILELAKIKENSSNKEIIIPLQQGDKTYGYVYLKDKISNSRFSKDDQRLITTIANQITKGAENFILLNEMLKTQAYENELKITSSFQRSLLPNKATDSSYYDVSFFSRPAKIMGGDFYDFFHVDKRKCVFLIADVSGKSLPAALFMAVTNSIIRTIGKLHELSTSEILHEANDLVYENSEAGMFVTVFYSVYNPYTHRFTYSSAGHNEQLLYRHDQESFETLQCKGSPLGVMPSHVHKTFGMKDTYLKPGDILIFYTDGVVESMNSAGEEFGMERLKKTIQENHFLGTDQMTQQIYRAAKNFTGNEEQFDDITIMIVKILH